MTVKNTSSGQELIDATQNAIIQAADKVSELIEPSHSHGHGTFYENPEFWVGMAFVFVVLLLAKPVSKIFTQMMKKRIVNIANKIDEAAQLKDDAQKILAEYETKFQNVRKETDALMKKMQKKVETMKQEQLNKLEMEIDMKKREANDRIKASQAAAEKEIITNTSKLAIDAVRKILAQKIDDKTHDALINDAIEKVI